MGSQRVRHDWVTFTSLHFINYKVLRWIIWGRKFSLKNKNLLLSKFGKAINKTLKKYSPVLELSVEILDVIQFSSVQFRLSVMSDSLQPHESQHARPPCSSPALRVHSNSPPSSQWCHPAISSSVVPFSSCPQSLPASESFPMSQLFAWGGQSTGVSASASFLPKKAQGWSPSEWTSWISLQSKGLSRVFSRATVQKHQFFFYCCCCCCFLILFFNFTILYWFCHISTWICHRYTRVPHPEPSSLLPPCTINLDVPQEMNG